jgi:PAS domain S-box-containing protein
MLPVLGTALLPLDQQGFAESAFAKASVTWSDDVQSDPRFAFTLFRQFVHRSGVVVPVQVDGHVAGAFYLVWWERARRFVDDELAMLEAVGQQVALLLRSAWLLQEARRRSAQAEDAERRYRQLVDNVPIGIYRTTLSGEFIDVNPAMVETLRFPSREAMLASSAVVLYVDPEDRRRGMRMADSAGVIRNFEVELRLGDGTRLWVRINSRRVKEGDEEFLEGTLEDITAARRVETAERRAEALRAVTLLAGAAAHEINNPLAIITGRLELLRGRLGPAEQQRLQPAFDAARRITGIITDMGRVTRLEVREDFGPSTILDLRRSGQPDQPPAE